jgi:hypothetical protein
MEAIFSAARENDVESLSLLIPEVDFAEKKHLLDATDIEGKTPVTIAIENRSFEAARWLVGKGCRLGKHVNNHSQLLSGTGKTFFTVSSLRSSFLEDRKS